MRSLSVVAASALVLTEGCTTTKSLQTASAVKAIQARVESLEATSNALTTELIEKHGNYVVGRGDTLTLIAKRFNLQVRDILRMNPDLVSVVPTNWKPGLVIIVREEEPNKAD
jgi:LysM repeat protein